MSDSDQLNLPAKNPTVLCAGNSSSVFDGYSKCVVVGVRKNLLMFKAPFGVF